MLHVQIFHNNKSMPDEFDCNDEISIVEEEIEFYDIDFLVVSKVYENDQED